MSDFWGLKLNFDILEVFTKIDNFMGMEFVVETFFFLGGGGGGEVCVCGGVLSVNRAIFGVISMAFKVKV